MKLPLVKCDLCGAELQVDNLKVEGGRIVSQEASQAFTLSTAGKDGTAVYLYICRSCVSSHGAPLQLES
jgi:hypothetical protein